MSATEDPRVRALFELLSQILAAGEFYALAAPAERPLDDAARDDAWVQLERMALAWRGVERSGQREDNEELMPSSADWFQRAVTDSLVLALLGGEDRSELLSPGELSDRSKHASADGTWPWLEDA